ncbi:MAG: LGFP repeat-containing protein [Canibacter sp.]
MRKTQLSEKLTRKGGRVLRWYAATLSILALTFGVLVSQPTAAEAANITDGFDPTNIVSDAQFYAGRAMTPAQIQKFLNDRVPRCTIGDPGRKAGSKTPNGNTVASKCLKDLKVNTTSKASNANCAAYAGKKNESAAVIISKVGSACGISQKALLIMLEKEQSLVTDTWPTTRMYNYAMGWSCPDSGPGNSANCDPSAANFFTQVYKSAWQLKQYLYNPNAFNYKAGVNNTVQWHPNASCGTSTFKIKNNATAALYIYTPYRPNAAALKAGWGTGDSCSTYGNRNFYNFWKSWFGKPNSGVAVDGDIAAYAKGREGSFGTAAKAAVSYTGNGGGIIQEFTKVYIFKPNNGKISHMTKSSPLWKALSAAGGVNGSWGWPTEPAVSRGSGISTMKFTNGYLAEKGGKAFLVPSALSAYWLPKLGTIGYPTAAAVSANSATHQSFEKSLLVSDADKTVRVFDPAFSATWLKAGGVKSALGTPKSAAATNVANGKVYELTKANMFKNPKGTISTAPAGRFLTAYMSGGGPSNTAFGWPTANAECSLPGEGCALPVEKGVGLWSPNTGIVATETAIYDAWKPQAGALGYPSSAPKALGAGKTQVFPGGEAFSSSDGAYFVNNGALLDEYKSRGGATGALGFPIGSSSCTGDTCSAPFSGGTLVVDPVRGTQVTPPTGNPNPSADSNVERLKP